MTTPDTDYLAVIPLVVAQLKDALGSDVQVLEAADLAGLEEAQQPTPAVHVIYDGDVVGESLSNGKQAIDHRLMLVVVVDNTRQGDGGESSRQEAGPLMASVIKAVAGWKPSNDYSAMKRTNGLRPGYTDRHAYFPLVFLTRLTTR